MKSNAAARKEDPFARHKDARDRLAGELSHYTGQLVPELESVLANKNSGFTSRCLSG